MRDEPYKKRIHLISFLHKRIGEIKYQKKFCNLRRLEASGAHQIYPSLCSADLFANPRNKHQNEHNEAYRVSRIDEFLQNVIIKPHQDDHSRKTYRKIYDMTLEEIICVSELFESVN